MSAPDTNTEKEVKKHRPSLRGIVGVVIFALVILLALIIWTFAQSDGPEDSGAQVDGRTGEIEEPEGN